MVLHVLFEKGFIKTGFGLHGMKGGVSILHCSSNNKKISFSSKSICSFSKTGVEFDVCRVD